MDKIRQQQSGKAYILVMWSTDCMYCAEELRYFGKLKKQRPTLPVILIATDNISQSDLIQSLLTEFQLPSVPSYAFADDYAERLRWEIDPAWYGELPRTYLVAADGARQALSGQISPQLLESWMLKHLSKPSR
ncbi:MAG: TlpA family protein disulfide reductase [Proteobacteria bacterium]|nr:TlpA family protein disulfide reductase [Pseudomonadota bacterium]